MPADVNNKRWSWSNLINKKIGLEPWNYCHFPFSCTGRKKQLKEGKTERKEGKESFQWEEKSNYNKAIEGKKEKKAGKELNQRHFLYS